MQLTIQPTLDGSDPPYVLTVYMRPSWRHPGFWKADIAVYPDGAPTGPPVARDVYDGLTFLEAGDVIEATLRGLPLV